MITREEIPGFFDALCNCVADKIQENSVGKFHVYTRAKAMELLDISAPTLDKFFAEGILTKVQTKNNVFAWGPDVDKEVKDKERAEHLLSGASRIKSFRRSRKETQP